MKRRPDGVSTTRSTTRPPGFNDAIQTLNDGLPTPTAHPPVTLSFAELEQLAGPLPPSAHRGRSWWANTPGYTQGAVLDALEMASWQRGTRLEGLVAHSDAGSQFTSIRFWERLAGLGAQPSIGTVGDSFDCEHDGVAVRPGLTPVMTDFVSLR